MVQKRIDFIIGSLKAGGAERVVANLANYISKKGHIVRIITFNKGGGYELAPEIKVITLDRKFLISKTLVRAIYELLIFYKKPTNRPHIINSHINLMSLAAFPSAKIFGIKLISSEHSNHLFVENKLLNYLVWNFIYRHIDGLTLLTNFDLDFFKKRVQKIEVIGNPTSFVPINKKTLRHKIILGIGDMNRYEDKGFDTLIKVLAPILIENPLWKLKLVGAGGSGITQLKELSKDMGILDQVIFTGYINNVNHIMVESEIFVLSSKYEGLPMALLEAMSQGMACISYDCISGPADIIENNVNGLLVENQNKLQLQLGIKKLIENEALRKKLQKKAPNSISKYSMENVGNKWLKLIDEVYQN